MRNPTVKTSEQLLREAKRWVYVFLGCLILGLLLEWLGFPGAAAMKPNEPLVEVVATAVTVLGLLLIDCTEIILAAIKEASGGERPKAHP